MHSSMHMCTDTHTYTSQYIARFTGDSPGEFVVAATGYDIGDRQVCVCECVCLSVCKCVCARSLSLARSLSPYQHTHTQAHT